MKRRVPIYAAAALLLLPTGAAMAGGFGHHVYNPHFYGGRAPAVRGHCGPTFHRAPIFTRNCGPTYFRGAGGFVDYGHAGFGNRYHGDRFGGFVNYGAVRGGTGFVAVNRGRLSVAVPFQLPQRCGVGVGKRPRGAGFTHFSGVHNFYGGQSSVADYASYYATRRHGDD